jgi:hypothetical protein
MPRRRGPSQRRSAAHPRGQSLGSRPIGSGERPRRRGAAGIGGFRLRRSVVLTPCKPRGSSRHGDGPDDRCNTHVEYGERDRRPSSGSPEATPISPVIGARPRPRLTRALPRLSTDRSASGSCPSTWAARTFPPAAARRRASSAAARSRTAGREPAPAALSPSSRAVVSASTPSGRVGSRSARRVAARSCPRPASSARRACAAATKHRCAWSRSSAFRPRASRWPWPRASAWRAWHGGASLPRPSASPRGP